VRQSAELLEVHISICISSDHLDPLDGDVNILEIAASLPLDPLELSLSVREVAQAVKTTAERHTTAGRRAVRVLVVGIQGSMEVLVKISRS
jgi:hypothetical protein